MNTRENWVALLAKSLEHTRSEDGDHLQAQLYTPDARIPQLLAYFERYQGKASPTKAEREEAGNRLEALAFLAFRSLAGCSTIKSYQSVGPQFDLVVNGDTVPWLFLTGTFLQLPAPARGIILEAKATSQPADDKVMARMCALVEERGPYVGLGVLFTLRGATGFPRRTERQIALRAARLRQVLFHARTGKPIVVLDWEDLRTLGEPGSLVRILATRIRGIMDLHQTDHRPTGCVEVQLPKHLAPYADPEGTSGTVLAAYSGGDDLGGAPQNQQ